MRRLGFAEEGAQDFADALDREIADRSTKLDLKELELRMVRWLFLFAALIIAAIGVMIRHRSIAMAAHAPLNLRLSTCWG